ncbi:MULTISPECIES: cytoskeleton protein RodZ [Providencia]|uniref:Cytoskeleton protein RodZ n=1 Tax=Providencia alcalifaciens 205/92 TaxID=1256988 RepID=A0AAV3M0U2_9GAMM|nr:MULTISPECIES: cytoskeleton protein RodZ [Providencia]EKT67198.1 cytoskeletal protein RodZ [Providencia alcalifaciens Dmel2]EUD07229.1 putative cytoskeleton protein RodZ [Providencia alcalifaciens R90-1475]EUD09309.1 putative cytoskeleton protein RodZ [Providencia alcalifaciens 205/92]MBF0690874.1 cytoskeleton protein RodZ [Providencia alcalifaciens]MTC15767.1 cytoskeleton protein RodZ [Providencia alcalifaciens]
MTIENNTEQTSLTVGQLLSRAREHMGLTQEAVAERLCLKVSTVKEIEQDIHPAGVEPTFLRGYIRLYARMVGIPENDINSLLKSDVPAQAPNVSPMQSYSLGKKRKKREGWLMKLTWLIVIILIAMIGIWWWQDHNAQQKDLLTMANQNDLVLTQQDTSSEPVSNVTVDAPLANNNSAEQAEPAPVLTDAQTTTTNTETDGVKTIPLPNAPQTIPSVDRVQADATQTADMPAVTSNGLTLNFSGQCWLEIRDANNKVLFSGMKNSGDKLELDGAQPYRLNIGAPANVTVQFQGKDVDLSRFIKAKRSAKFKLPEA